MATKQIKKLSDLQKITTATGDQMIPVVDASGNVNPIKLTDLAQVVAGLIGFKVLKSIYNFKDIQLYKIYSKKETSWQSSLLIIMGDNNKQSPFFIALTNNHKNYISGVSSGAGIPEMFYDQSSVYIKMNRYSNLNVLSLGKEDAVIEESNIETESLTKMDI